MTQIRIPVHTWISGAAFVKLERKAKAADTTVAVLVAHLAEQTAAKMPDRPVRRYVRMTDEHRIQIADLHRLNYGPRAIAAEVGVSLRAVQAEIARPKGGQG